MKKGQFMILDYPQLVKYFASKNPFQLLIFVIPLWVGFAFFIHKFDLSALATIFGLIFGVVYWSFLEYAIHRFLYHPRYKFKWMYYFLGSFHLYHHQDMSDRRVFNAGFVMIYFVTPTVLLPLILFTKDWGFLSAVGLGLSVSYYFYEWVHFMLHYKFHEKGYLGYIQRYHFHHHEKSPHKNFGNTSHLWDVLFGTYDARYKDYVMPQAARETLITEVPEVVHATI
jgi:4-hydroxysphinganine ceramide fatty acyl 2-hydroxylase